MSFFFLPFFLSLVWLFFEGSKISFHVVPGPNPATHRTCRSDCPLPLQSSFLSVCAPVNVGVWIQTPAHQTLKLQEDFQRFPVQVSPAAISSPFSPFPFPLLCPPTPTQISPANSNLPRKVSLSERACPSKQTQG